VVHVVYQHHDQLDIARDQIVFLDVFAPGPMRHLLNALRQQFLSERFDIVSADDQCCHAVLHMRCRFDMDIRLRGTASERNNRALLMLGRCNKRRGGRVALATHATHRDLSIRMPQPEKLSKLVGTNRHATGPHHTNMQPIITATDLVKEYPGVLAVDGISLSIPKGICFGLLGPNGAGKTTTIEILEGIHLPTSGTVLYKGEPLGTRYREEVGIQFQHTALQEYLTVRETLVLFERLYQKTLPIPEIIELCSLTDILERDTRKLSGGQRQRLLLALALINDPDLIFLDEPTTGLDPQARRNFWDLVKLVKSRNKTIVLTTHYMEEAYALCDEVAIMDKGRIVSQGTPAQLLSQHFEDVILQLPGSDTNENLAGLGLNIAQAGDMLEIRTSRLHHTLQQLIASGANLDRLRIRAWTLEDLFINVTGKKLNP